MAIQSFSVGQVLTSAQMSALQLNDYNQTVSTKTANYVLVATDAGTKIVMNSASATTITVNTSLFAAGDTLTILNIGAGACTITPGTATVSSATSLVLVQYGSGTLYFTSAGVSVFQANSSVSTTISDTNRNVIINGAMQVAQRVTSQASITASTYYTADRFLTSLSSLGTWTQSVEADAPTGSGLRKSLKMLCTTADASPAAGDFHLIQQLIEGQNLQQFAKGTASAKPFALSFWVKSNVTGTYIAELNDSDNNRQVSFAYTVSVSATWEKKTITFPADITGAFDNDNASSLGCNFWLGAGTSWTSGTLQNTWVSNVSANRAVGQTNLAAATSNYWQVTGVQLEVGSVPTPFEFENIGETIAKCERYYQKSYNDGVAVATNTNNGLFGTGSVGNASGLHLNNVYFKVDMRTTPTIQLWVEAATGGAGFWTVFSSPQPSGYNGGAFPIGQNTKGMVVVVSDGGYAWQPGSSRGHWEASAEL